MLYNGTYINIAESSSGLSIRWRLKRTETVVLPNIPQYRYVTLTQPPSKRRGAERREPVQGTLCAACVRDVHVTRFD